MAKKSAANKEKVQRIEKELEKEIIYAIIKYMEKVDLIDKNGNLTGKVETRKEVHKNGLPHQASGLIIVRREKNGFEILSQQRSFKKEKNAGLWDMSASGHIPSGENPEDSLVREVQEELGINVKLNELKLLGKFWRNEIYRQDFVENELDYIYILEKNIDINKVKIQKEEVEQVKYIDVETFKNMLKQKKAVTRKGVWLALFKFIQNANCNL